MYEINLMIVDFLVEGRNLMLELCLNVEVFLVGIDLFFVLDMDEVVEVVDYDVL